MIFPQRAEGLSFVTPVAYDHRYALAAIEAYYGIADEIILGVDKDRISWNGGSFELDLAAFKKALEPIDTRAKIRVIEGDFHSQGSGPANDTHERNELSKHCAEGNWVVQIDSDELVQNPLAFRDWLVRRRGPWLVLGQWTTVFKVFGDDYLVIDKDDAWISVATRRKGLYTGCRDTKEFQRRAPLKMLHFSWGRSETELWQKLQNWTHAKDFDTAKFFEFWKGITLENYKEAKDFHPMDGPDWPALKLLKKGEPGWVAPPK